MPPAANYMYGLDNALQDRQGNQWSLYNGGLLHLGDHIILSNAVSGRDRCQPGVVTHAPRPGERRRNYKVSVHGRNGGIPTNLIAFFRRGDGSVPDNAIARIPHLSTGKWVAANGHLCLQRGQAVKIRTRQRALQDQVGIFDRLKVTKASVQFGDDNWSIPIKSICEYQEMS